MSGFGKKLSAGLGLLRHGVNLGSIFEFVEPFLTPENIHSAKEKVVEFSLAQQVEIGGPVVLWIELTANQKDLALMVFTRNPQKAGGLELQKQYFLSQITPASIATLVEKFKNLQHEHGI